MAISPVDRSPPQPAALSLGQVGPQAPVNETSADWQRFLDPGQHPPRIGDTTHFGPTPGIAPPVYNAFEKTGENTANLTLRQPHPDSGKLQQVAQYSVGRQNMEPDLAHRVLGSATEEGAQPPASGSVRQGKRPADPLERPAEETQRPRLTTSPEAGASGAGPGSPATPLSPYQDPGAPGPSGPASPPPQNPVEQITKLGRAAVANDHQVTQKKIISDIMAERPDLSRITVQMTLEANGIGRRNVNRDRPTQINQIHEWINQKITSGDRMSDTQITSAIASEHPNISRQTIASQVSRTDTGNVKQPQKTPISRQETVDFRAYARPFQARGVSNLEIAQNYVAEGRSTRNPQTLSFKL